MAQIQIQLNRAILDVEFEYHKEYDDFLIHDLKVTTHPKGILLTDLNCRNLYAIGKEISRLFDFEKDIEERKAQQMIDELDSEKFYEENYYRNLYI